MTPRSHPLLVVGYDGTLSARAAVSIAIDRVHPSGHLIIVRAFETAPIDGDDVHLADRLEEDAELAVATITELVNEEPRFAFVDWERMVVAGDPARVLTRIAAARHADGIVVGCRSVGQFGTPRGSVAQAVLRRADRPVIVVPEAMVSGSGFTELDQTALK